MNKSTDTEAGQPDDDNKVGCELGGPSSIFIQAGGALSLNM